MRRIALVISLVVAAFAATTSSALAAGTPAWSVSGNSSPSKFTEGDGVRGWSSFGANDTQTITVSNTGTAPSSGTVTVNFNWVGGGFSLKDLLNSWATGNGSISTGSNTITNVTDTNPNGYPWAAGNSISGTGIPANTTITGVTLVNGNANGTPDNYTLTLSANATATNAAVALTELAGSGADSTGSPTVSGVAGGPYEVGNAISGTGIPSGTTISALSGSTCSGTPTVCTYSPTGTTTITLSTSGVTSTNPSVDLTEAATVIAPTGSGWTCTTSSSPTCTTSAPAAANSSLPPITLTLQTSPTAGVGSAGGPSPLHVTTSVNVSGGGASGTALGQAVVPIRGVPDFTSTIAPNGAFRQGDATDSYHIQVIDQGAGTSNGSTNPVVATMTAPTGGETIVGLSGGGWTCTLTAITSPVNVPANSCYRTDSAGYAAELPPITMVVSTASNAATPQSVSAVLSGGQAPGVAAGPPVTTTYSTTVQQSADLIADSVHVGNFSQGDPTDYYYIYSRNIVGPNSTVGGPSIGPVTITDTVPPGETITSLSGPGWVCSTAPYVVTGTPNVVYPEDSCTRSDPLAVNANYPNILVTVAVDNGAQSPLGNTVTISGGGMTAASSANGGQTFTDSTVINQEPDLHITGLSESGGSTLDDGPMPFTQGDGVGAGDQYVVTVSNDGFASTSGQVTVTDTIPADLTAAGTPTASGWSCGVNGQAVTCTRSDPLAPASQYPAITVPVTVSANAASVADNLLQVSGGGEINLANDSDAEQSYVTQLPDLTVGVTDSGNFEPGGTGSFSIIASNVNLASTTAPITVTATISSGMVATSVSGPGWSCAAPPTVSCTTTSALQPGPSSLPAITVGVSIHTTATAPQSATATVSGGGEAYTANDTATDTVTFGVAPGIRHRADSVSSSKTAGRSSSATHPASLRGLTRRVTVHGARYTVSGRLVLGAGASHRAACTGEVGVRLSHNGRTVVRRSVNVTRGCTYRTSGRLQHKMKAKSLRAKVWFGGNAAVAAFSAR
jgi:hypothetical protein